MDTVRGLNDKDNSVVTPNVSDDGPTPSDYRIDYADAPVADQSLKWQPGQTRTVTLNRWDNEGLKAGLTRYYRIFPINGNVFGEADNASNTVEVANVADPDQVLNLRQTGMTTTSITMSWEALPGADGYEISYAGVNESDGLPVTAGEGAWSTPKKITETTYTHMGLLPGEARWYRVLALDGTTVVPGTGGAEALGMTGRSRSTGNADWPGCRIRG